MSDARHRDRTTGGGVRRSSAVAGALAVGSVLVLAVAAAMDVASRGVAVPAVVGPWYGRLIWTASVAIVPLVGWLLVHRVPGNRYGWVWLWLGTAASLLSLASSYAVLGAFGGAPLPAPTYVALVGDLLWFATIALVPLLLLWFPDGRLPSPRWRWTHRTILVAAALAAAFAWARDGTLGIAPLANPLGRPGRWSVVSEVVVGSAVVAVFVCFLAGVWSLLARYRRGGAQERLQVRWLAVASVLFSLTIWVDPPGVWDQLFEAVALATLPAAVTIAVLRYRLYEIDRVLSRTLTYAVITAVLLGVYVVSVVTLGAVVRGLTGRASSDLVVAAGTLTAAAVFQPARRRVAAAVDRRFDRARYDAHVTVERFGQRLRDEVDLETLSHELLGVAGHTVSPRSASLWLRHDGQP